MILIAIASDFWSILSRESSRVSMAGTYLIVALIVISGSLLIHFIRDSRLRISTHHNQSNTTKAFGLLVTTAIALLANNGWVYSVAVFIFASLMTDISFLENIAAIFRGGDYFTYKKNVRSPDITEAAKEDKETIKTRDAKSNHMTDTVEQTSLMIKNSDSLQAHPDKASTQASKYYETIALNYLSSYLQMPIEHEARLTRRSQSILLDGFIDGKARDTRNHLCIEVKQFQASLPTPNDLAQYAQNIAIKVEAVTSEFAETLLFIVYDDDIKDYACGTIARAAEIGKHSRFIYEIIGISKKELVIDSAHR